MDQGNIPAKKVTKLKQRRDNDSMRKSSLNEQQTILDPYFGPVCGQLEYKFQGKEDGEDDVQDV